MSSRPPRLELTWVGKDQRPRLEPRILLEDPEKSYCAATRRGPSDRFDNLLIHGDNLLALKALEHDYTGKVKCIYIDPPYNTGSAFTHYDDGIEHSLWLTMMRDRLEILRRLLREDGSIWISLDDNEQAYGKVLCDEVFGRENFITNVIWQKIYTTKNSARHLSSMHDFIMVYAADHERWQRNLVPRSDEANASYSNPDGDPRGPWTTNAIQARNFYSQGTYEITSPSGRKFLPPSGTFWRVSRQTFDQLNADGRVYWGPKGENVPRIKRFLAETKEGVVPSTLWLHTETGQNAEAKEEVRAFTGDDSQIFVTPKPERLLHRILHIATNPGDLVLDSFAGSGTTGAVAHKMGRRWIMVELGDHCDTHIVPRLKKVIDGADPGGVTAATGWQGGGGFRYLRLAPSLMMRDADEQWVVSPDYNAPMLVEAVCKHEGFRYQPSETVYWQQGRSTEQDFLYVTTQMLTPEHLERLSAEVGPDRHLLVYCAAFACAPDRWPNLTLRKMPNALLDRCEWGRDDYSLKVASLPEGPADAASTASAPGTASTTPDKAATGRGRKKKPDAPEAQPGLFGSPSTEPEESP